MRAAVSGSPHIRVDESYYSPLEAREAEHYGQS